MKIINPLLLWLGAAIACPAQTVQIITPANFPKTVLNFRANDRQIFPVLYPSENINTNIVAGTNSYTLNPGWWTVSIAPAGMYNIYVDPASGTNNLLSIVSNPPPAVALSAIFVLANNGHATNLVVSNLTVNGTVNGLSGGGGGGGSYQFFPQSFLTNGNGQIDVTGELKNISTNDAALLTNLNASALASGTVPLARLPISTSSAAGIVKPDNTTITITDGVISSTSGGGNYQSGSQTLSNVVNQVSTPINLGSGTNLPATGISPAGSVAGQVLTSGGATTGWASLPNSASVNVLLFGAVEDGLTGVNGGTDNNQAISNALAACGDYGTLYFPHTNTHGGGYKVSGKIFVTNNYVTFLGDGVGTYPGIGSPCSFKSAIMWSNLTTNCFTITSKGATFQNISAYWTNTMQPTGGAFATVTTNADQINGEVFISATSFLADGGYRIFDYQGTEGTDLQHCTFVRAYMDGIRLNNLANNDVGGWSISDSYFAMVGNGTTPHEAEAAMELESGFAGSINNVSCGAFNWGSYGDTGGYTNAVHIKPNAEAGLATSGLHISGGLFDNWSGNGVATEAGNIGFTTMTIEGVQIESYVSGHGNCIALGGGVGDICLIDNCISQSDGGQSFVLLNGMDGVTVGNLAVQTVPWINNVGGSSTGVRVGANGQGIFDNYLANPQFSGGSTFLQSEGWGDNDWWMNALYGNGWFEYQGAGYASHIGFHSGLWQLNLYASGAANGAVGNPTATFTATQAGNFGFNTVAPAFTGTINGTLGVSNNIVLATNGTTPPMALSGSGIFWCSNTALYWVTPTHTNLISAP